MKLSKLFFGVAAAAMFAACSSDDIVATEQAPEWNADGTGYVTFSINTAEEVASRGVNDNYVNGPASEYEVKDVTLVICKADGTVLEAYNLTDTNFGGPNVEGSNVTADKLYVQKIDAVEANPYAFVILNKNGLFTISGKTLQYGGTTVANINDLATKTQATDLNATEFTTNGILMMNAPLSTAAGMTADPSGATLSYFVNPLKVYKTQAEAEAHAEGVGEVYVERAVAKVEVKGTDTASDDLVWTLEGWTLDNTNKSSYLLHNVSNMDATMLAYKATGARDIYRMVGSKDVQHNMPASLGTATEQHRYRTYFGLDPNMSEDKTTTAFNRPATPTFGTAAYQYCAENLFDVKHQNYANTTRALLKVNLTSTTTYFSKPGDDHFYAEADVKKAAEAQASKNIAASALWSYAKYVAGKDKVEFTSTISGGNVTVTAANVHINDITEAQANAAGYTGATAVDDAKAAFAALLNQTLAAADFGFSYYAGGVAYYDVRIKHFGEEYTPWSVTGTGLTTTALSYPSYNADLYLGRWGVLRNNWYEVDIKKISKLGYADPADLDLDPSTDGGHDPETPDDNRPAEEKWISVDVNILSWAKRVQEENL